MVNGRDGGWICFISCEASVERDFNYSQLVTQGFLVLFLSPFHHRQCSMFNAPDASPCPPVSQSPSLPVSRVSRVSRVSQSPSSTKNPTQVSA